MSRDRSYRTILSKSRVKNRRASPETVKLVRKVDEDLADMVKSCGKEVTRVLCKTAELDHSHDAILHKPKLCKQKKACPRCSRINRNETADRAVYVFNQANRGVPGKVSVIGMCLQFRLNCGGRWTRVQWFGFVG